jgi:hypothetical protein
MLSDNREKEMIYYCMKIDAILDKVYGILSDKEISARAVPRGFPVIGFTKLPNVQIISSVSGK